MYLLIIFLPLISAFLAGFAGRKLGVEGAKVLSSTLMGITFMLSVFVFVEVCLNGAPTYIELFS